MLSVVQNGRNLQGNEPDFVLYEGENDNLAQNGGVGSVKRWWRGSIKRQRAGVREAGSFLPAFFCAFLHRMKHE